MNLEQYLDSYIELHELSKTPKPIKLKVGTELGMFHINSEKFIENFYIDQIIQITGNPIPIMDVISKYNNYLHFTVTEQNMNDFLYSYFREGNDEYFVYSDMIALFNYIIKAPKKGTLDFAPKILRELIAIRY